MKKRMICMLIGSICILSGTAFAKPMTLGGSWTVTCGNPYLIRGYTDYANVSATLLIIPAAESKYLLEVDLTQVANRCSQSSSPTQMITCSVDGDRALKGVANIKIPDSVCATEANASVSFSWQLDHNGPSSS
jgi:hypothetical protein